MKVEIDEGKLKELLKDILVKMFEERREEIYEIFLEVIEDVGLVNAIREGRQNELVERDRIMELLKS